MPQCTLQSRHATANPTRCHSRRSRHSVDERDDNRGDLCNRHSSGLQRWRYPSRRQERRAGARRVDRAWRAVHLSAGELRARSISVGANLCLRDRRRRRYGYVRLVNGRLDRHCGHSALVAHGRDLGSIENRVRPFRPHLSDRPSHRVCTLHVSRLILLSPVVGLIGGAAFLTPMRAPGCVSKVSALVAERYFFGFSRRIARLGWFDRARCSGGH